MTYTDTRASRRSTARDTMNLLANMYARCARVSKQQQPKRATRVRQLRVIATPSPTTQRPSDHCFQISRPSRRAYACIVRFSEHSVLSQRAIRIPHGRDFQFNKRRSNMTNTCNVYRNTNDYLKIICDCDRCIAMCDDYCFQLLSFATLRFAWESF